MIVLVAIIAIISISFTVGVASFGFILGPLIGTVASIAGLILYGWYQALMLDRLIRMNQDEVRNEA